MRLSTPRLHFCHRHFLLFLQQGRATLDGLLAGPKRIQTHIVEGGEDTGNAEDATGQKSAKVPPTARRCNLQLALTDVGSELDVLLGSAGDLLGGHGVGFGVMTGWDGIVKGRRWSARKEKGKTAGVFRAVWAAKIFCGPALRRLVPRFHRRPFSSFDFSTPPPLPLLPPAPVRLRHVRCAHLNLRFTWL